MLVRAVNSDSLSAETITLKFLVVEHTFMSADNIHAGVEGQMKEMQKVECFADFVSAVSYVNKGDIIAHEVQVDEFREWKDESSPTLLKATGRPKLRGLSVIQFRRGSTDILYKKDIFQENFESFKFLKKTVRIRQLPRKRSRPAGITTARRAVIIKSLVGLLRPIAKPFWRNLPVNETPENLTVADMEDE